MISGGERGLLTASRVSPTNVRYSAPVPTATAATKTNSNRQPRRRSIAPPIRGEKPGAAAVAIVIDAIARVSPCPSNRSRATARDNTATAQTPAACIDRPTSRLAKSPANAHHAVPSTKTHSPVTIGAFRPSLSDNGPTTSCPAAKTTRKTGMLDVTAALDTSRSAAIAGNEGRKMLVDSRPIAAKAQITPLAAMLVRCPDLPAATLAKATSLLMSGALAD